jgi:hypothetical protein
MKLAWSEKVSYEFCAALLEMCCRIKVIPDFMMACMAFESGETFSPSVKNAAGSGATGLIQFMPATAKALGTTTEALAKMTAIEQLEYVEKYFKPYTGRLLTLEDTYMAILYPAAIGKPANYVLFSSGKAYQQNKGIDKNKDGVVTRAEAALKVYEKLRKGFEYADFDAEKYFAEFQPEGLMLIKGAC